MSQSHTLGHTKGTSLSVPVSVGASPKVSAHTSEILAYDYVCVWGGGGGGCQSEVRFWACSYFPSGEMALHRMNSDLIQTFSAHLLVGVNLINQQINHKLY